MRFLFLALLVAAIIFCVQGKTREEMKARWKALADECQKSSGASDDELEKVMTHAKPETHDGKCMIACMLETMGVVSR